MKNKVSKCLVGGALVALSMASWANDFAQERSQQQNAQAVSQTGLLPVYGVDFNFDALWVDGEKFPSQSAVYPNSGVNAAFQRVWDSLAASSFNTIRFTVDVSNKREAATRVANLCVWAKTNNVRLIPTLIGSDRNRSLESSFSDDASEFVKALVSSLRKDGGQQLEAYAQILTFQIENEMNHAGLHPRLSAQEAQARLIKTAADFRKAEQQGLKETGLSPTPLMVNASFDYELIKARAIAGTTLADDAYARGYQSLKQFLELLASAQEIDILGVDWFAGSISAGSVEKFSAFLRNLTSDVPGKQVVFTTGFSTGFNSAEDQKNFYALAFANLADYRASEGIDSPFTGVVFREAASGRQPDPTPPSSRITREMAGWNWTAKADELARMWSGQAESEALAWWFKKVENNFGVLALTPDSRGGVNVTPQPAYEALQQIASAITDANATDNTTTNPGSPDPNQPSVLPPGQPAPPGTDPPTEPLPPGEPALEPGGTGTGMRAALKNKVQEGLMSILDRALERVNNKIFGNTGGASGGVEPPAPGSPPGDPGALPPDTIGGAAGALSLSKSDVRLEPARPRVGEPVAVNVTLHNQSTDADASGVVVALLNDAGAMLDPPVMATAIAVPRGSTQNVTLPWTPAEANTYRVSVGVFDSSGTNQLASASLDPFSVTAGTGASVGGTGSTNLREMLGSRLAARALGNIAIIPSSQSMRMPLGLPQVQSFIINSATQSANGAQLSSMTFSLGNPLARPMNDVEATLMVDGRPMQIRNIGSLMPKQNRSLMFTNVTLPQSGQHEVKLMLTSRGPRPLTGYVANQVRIVSSATPPAGMQPGSTTRPSLARDNPGVRSIIPPSYTLGRLRVPTGSALPGAMPGTNSAPIGSTGRPSPGAATRPAGRAMPAPDLSVTTTDIRYSPTAPRPGDEVTFYITVHNNGTVKANGAKVTCMLFAGNKIVDRKEFDEDIEPGRSLVAKWKVKSHSNEPMRLNVTASTAQDTNSRDNSADVTVGEVTANNRPLQPNTPGRNSGQPSSPDYRNNMPGLANKPGILDGLAARPDLSVTASDIRLSPQSPKAGDSVTFDIVVRNIGKMDAKGARVYCAIYADGRAAERTDFDVEVKAGGTKSLQWKIKMPSARQVRLEVNSIVAQEAESRNNRASIDISLGLENNRAPVTLPGVRPSYQPPVASAKPDLSLSTGDIRYSPTAPRINDKLDFSINVRNVGKADARGVTVTCVLYADGRVAGQRQFSADIRAGGSYPLRWSALTPKANQLP